MINSNMNKNNLSEYVLTILWAAGWQRISLLIALMVSAVLLFWPAAVIGQEGQVSHGNLSILLIANSLAFIHGVGFKPHNRLGVWACSPLIAWPLIVVMLLGF